MSGSKRGQAVTGPLAPYAAGFAAELAAKGYSPSAVRLRLWLLNHMSAWLLEEGLSVGSLTTERASQFIARRRAKGYRTWVSERSVRLPMEYLWSVGALPAPVAEVDGPVDALVDAYGRYLVRERGLAATTVRDYSAIARSFLSSGGGSDVVDLGGLVAGDVTAFVGRECARRGVSSAKYMVVGLRSLLRYLHVAGLLEVSLAEAVPAVADRRGSGLPRGLSAGEVARLLTSCDRRRAVGRRDHAILTLLVRLGLRAGEVAALQLDDIDWHRGEIVVRGKGNRHERLPLPTDVGEAVAGYLRRGRPPSHHRGVFLRVNAPEGGLRAAGVSGVVHDACVRAGIPPVGAHRLRHTAATEMLRFGGSLPEIAQVLRHRQLETTAIYAKVDRAALAGLARPWPGSGS